MTLTDKRRDKIHANILEAAAVIRSYQTYDNRQDVKAAYAAMRDEQALLEVHSNDTQR